MRVTTALLLLSLFLLSGDTLATSYGEPPGMSYELFRDAENFSKWVRDELDQRALEKNSKLTLDNREEHRRLGTEIRKLYIRNAEGNHVFYGIPESIPEFAKEKWVRGIIGDKVDRLGLLVTQALELESHQIETDPYRAVSHDSKLEKELHEALGSGVLGFLAFMSERVVTEKERRTLPKKIFKARVAGALSSLGFAAVAIAENFEPTIAFSLAALTSGITIIKGRRYARAKLSRLREIDTTSPESDTTSSEPLELYSFIIRDELLMKSIFQLIEKMERLPEKYDEVKKLGQRVKQNLLSNCANVLGAGGQ